MARNDNIPRINRPRSTHEHRENVVRCEYSSLILLSELLNDWVRRCSNIVGDTINDIELPFRILDGRFIV